MNGILSLTTTSPTNPLRSRRRAAKHSATSVWDAQACTAGEPTTPTATSCRTASVGLATGEGASDVRARTGQVWRAYPMHRLRAGIRRDRPYHRGWLGRNPRDARSRSRLHLRAGHGTPGKLRAVAGSVRKAYELAPPLPLTTTVAGGNGGASYRRQTKCARLYVGFAISQSGKTKNTSTASMRIVYA